MAIITKNVTIIGLEKVLARLKRLQPNTPPQRIMVQARNVGVSGLKKNFTAGMGWAPNTQSTIATKGSNKPNINKGGMRASIFGRVMPKLIEFVAPGIKAVIAHTGARDHLIVPRNKKALSFKQGGKRITVSQVIHPGIPARPFMKFLPITRQQMVALFTKWINTGI